MSVSGRENDHGRGFARSGNNPQVYVQSISKQQIWVDSTMTEKGSLLTLDDQSIKCLPMARATRIEFVKQSETSPAWS